MFDEDVAHTWWALFRGLASLTEVALLAGLVYQSADLATGGLLTHALPWVAIIWAWIQAAAITTHLAVLPVQALSHKQAGNQGRFKLAFLVTLLLVASASLALIGVQWPLLRAGALVGIVLVGRLSPQQRRALVVLKPNGRRSEHA